MVNNLPLVDFCGLAITRLVLGANPFGGFSHQNTQRDEKMRVYYTIERILETWDQAEAAGINTMVTNNETPNVVQAVKEYIKKDGVLQWIAQVNRNMNPDMRQAIDEVIKIGCKALYFHGGVVDELYRRRDAKTLGLWCEHARSAGVPVGVAGHIPQGHLWVNSLDIVDFHAVCFFNCGSVHAGGGEHFSLDDLGPAVNCIQTIQKPCIAYKVLGSGRLEPWMAFEYAFSHIKPGDIVNVGVYRGDNDRMIAENVAIVKTLLESSIKTTIGVG
jgi:hypothetical protein